MLAPYHKSLTFAASHLSIHVLKPTIMEEREDTTIYKVVVNHEEQYSIWPANRENALGWNDVGKSGLRQECLDYIREIWTDMRPLSLRKKMEEMERQRQAEQEG